MPDRKHSTQISKDGKDLILTIPLDNIPTMSKSKTPIIYALRGYNKIDDTNLLFTFALVQDRNSIKMFK
jgi:hypothetical protein